jgi:HAD superfamily hydrolase (TIGR01450 family)
MLHNKIFLDLDGTVYIDNSIIDKADEEIRRLDKNGLEFFYITNNTSADTNYYLTKLKKLNLPTNDKSIISPIHVISNWIQHKKYSNIYVVGVKDFENELIKRTGVKISTKDPECIIVGFDKELTYQKLETACKLISKGIPYYLSHIDYYCPSLEGNLPDCGSIGLLLEKTTGVKSKGNFGKPSLLMTEYIQNFINKKDSNILVGDRIHTDIEIGKKIGAKTILVCSGEFKKTKDQMSYIKDTAIYNTLSGFLRTL